MKGARGYFGDEDDVGTAEPADTSVNTDQPVGETPPESEDGEGVTQPVTEPTSTAAQTADTVESFDLDGVQFAGLTKEQTEALQRGVALNQDYTQKSQKLSTERQEFDAIVNEVQRNPMELRKYFAPQHLVAALGFDPAQVARGQKQPSATPVGDVDFDQFTPEAATVLKQQQAMIQQLGGQLNQMKGSLGKYDQRFEASDNASAQQDVIKEVDDAMSKYPILNNEAFKDYNKKLILGQIAATPNKSALEIANTISKSWAAQNGGVQQPSTTKVVKPGASVPMGQKMPDSFDDADASAHARYGVQQRR